MKRTLTIFYYTLLRNLRNTGDTLLQMVVFPIVLIFILGNALGGTFEQPQLGVSDIGYIRQDEGPVAAYFDEFLAGDEIAQLLNVHQVDSRQQGLEMLEAREIVALVELGEDFSQRVMEGKIAPILITTHPAFPLRAMVIENILESFVHGGNTLQALTAMGIEQPEFIFASGIIEDQSISPTGLTPRAIDYYGVTMMVMMVMYGALYASSGMSGSYLATIGQRIKTTPMRAAEQYIGLVLASVVTVFGQVVVIITFSGLVFQVNWGDNLPLVLLIALLLVVLAIGLGTMLVMLVRDERRAASIINTITVISTFIAGGYFRVNIPGVAGFIQYLSPNYLAQTAIFNTVYSGPPQQTIIMMAALLGAIIITFGIAMAAERRAIR